MHTFDERLGRLKQRFRDRAAFDSIMLLAVASDLEDGKLEAQQRTEIQRIAHNLAGAGGTFGFARIGKCATELEAVITRTSGFHEMAVACRTLVHEITHAA